MARILTVLLVTTVMAVSGRASQAPPTSSQSGSPPEPRAGGQEVPTFRSGTDLVTLDVSVLDGQGRPFDGLKPADFKVEINGQTRRVVAAEFVKADVPKTAAEAGTPGDRTVTATAGGTGRRILIAVDQLYIPPGSIKPLLNAASAFVDGLTPRDQAAFVVFPEPGPRVDFTSDRVRLRQAMQGLVGQPQRPRFGEFEMGLGEALTIYDKERYQIDQNNAETRDPPVVAEIMERSCPGSDSSAILRCRRQLLAQAVQMAQEARLDARISLRTLESIIQGLIPLEGAKSLVLISGSLAIDDRRELDTLIRLAGAARLSLNVIVVDVRREDKMVGGAARPPQRSVQAVTELADRRVLAEGLEELAADGRGQVRRLAGTGQSIFDALAVELSALYVLGVEARPEDLGSDLRKVTVAVKREKVRVRVSQAFVRTAAPAPRPLEDTLRDAISTRQPLTELSLQVATFSHWDPGSDKVRVRLAADVGIPQGDYVVGYVITDQDSRKVAEWSDKQTYVDTGPRAEPTPLGAPILLSPGVYSLQMAIVDQGGRRGTVVRELNIRRATIDGLAMSDLIVGNLPPPGEPLAMVREPRITGRGIVAYLELYSDKPADLDWTFVSFEIAQDPESPVLATETADMVDGKQPSWREASGFVDTSALPPGRYVVRARIVRDDKTLAVTTRPFVLQRSQDPAVIAPAVKADQP